MAVRPQLDTLGNPPMCNTRITQMKLGCFVPSLTMVLHSEEIQLQHPGRKQMENNLNLF